MRIDTKARWAIAAILDIAIYGTDQPVCLSDIGKRQGVSTSYLEHLFKGLRHSGFVAGARGPRGGYRLIRPLATISVADVIASVDSLVLSRDASRDTEAEAQDRSDITGGLWRRLDDHLQDYLRTVSLASVLATAREAEKPRKAPAVVAAKPRRKSLART